MLPRRKKRLRQIQIDSMAELDRFALPLSSQILLQNATTK